MNEIVLEICAASLDDVLVAQAAGASRIELNSAVSLGGLTPSMGLLELAIAESTIPVVAMCRPRPSGFCYSPADYRTLLKDVERSLECGAAGIAFGVLDSNGNVDEIRCREIVRLVGNRDAVFHRAFDLVPAPLEQAAVLCQCGVKRVMTSGGKTTAVEGKSHLARLVRQYADRIEILAAGGIRPENVRSIVEASGVTQVHAGLGTHCLDPSQPQTAGSVRFDAIPSENPGHYRVVCGDSVAKMVDILRDVGQV
jgi:copper homeostasis protein